MKQNRNYYPDSPFIEALLQKYSPENSAARYDALLNLNSSDELRWLEETSRLSLLPADMQEVLRLAWNGVITTSPAPL